MANDDNNTPGVPEKYNQDEVLKAQRLSLIFRMKLVNSFSSALQKSTEQFTWQEKADFLEALTEYAMLLRKNRQEADDFAKEKILKVFRSKLQLAHQLKLFDYFEQDIWSTGLNSLLTDVFKEIEVSEWEMTDEEYEKILITILHTLNGEFETHLIYGKGVDEHETAEAQDSLTGTPGLKGRISRASGDNLTRLSQEQTALFIELLRFARIILNDEHLNAKQAGIAFHILTGYSADSLRMKLSKSELTKLKTQANLNELHNALTRLTLQIESELKELKRTKSS